LVEAMHQAGAILKVIFENCYLQEKHKIRLCRICAELGVDFAKTSTGYGGGGATIEDLKLMRAHLPPGVQIKAAGGVRTLDALLEVRSIGVSRAGATQTAKMLRDCQRRLGLPLEAELAPEPAGRV
jgi:deoxyribose-phosphate aldolase